MDIGLAQKKHTRNFQFPPDLDSIDFEKNVIEI